MAWPTKTDFVDGDVLNASQMNNIGTNLNIFNPTAATNGQIWVANGSGSGAYSTVAQGGLTSLASGTFTTTFTLSSISQAYKQLQLDLWGFPSATSSTIQIRPNGVTTNCTSTNVQLESGVGATIATNNAAWQLNNNGVGYHYWSAQIFNYTNTTGNQTIFAQGVGFVVSTDRNNILLFGRRTTTDAITSITVNVGTTLPATARYTLYGVN